MFTPSGSTGSPVDSAAVSQFVAGVADRWDSVGALVNNAGVSHDGLLALMRADAIEQMIAVNLTGTIVRSQSCTKWMIHANRGAIVKEGLQKSFS
ncbi:SDR family NAD(P)-dependent oxidoreductase [Paraburkholderia phymatum]|uniref:SDR family NAD(P)-dependent oxidoreductase n=1 Tax=Paraburkholderia phymatum TaxID=148447 RepID=A0ACC6U7X0_9BURK